MRRQSARKCSVADEQRMPFTHLVLICVAVLVQLTCERTSQLAPYLSTSTLVRANHSLLC